MKKLIVRSLINDQTETSEIYECEHKIMGVRHMVAYSQPLFGGQARTVVTVENGRAVMLRRDPYNTKLEFDVNSPTVGSYFTGIGTVRVELHSSRVSVDETPDSTKIRLHYTLRGISDEDLNIKLCMIIGGEF